MVQTLRKIALAFIFLFPSLNCFGQSKIDYNTQIMNQPVTLAGGIPALILPLASTATATSVTNISSTSATFNCTTPGCGFSAGQSGLLINIGQGLGNLPLICQGPATLSTVSGNSATFTGMGAKSCAASAGTYSSIFGTYGGLANLLYLIPAQGNNTPGATPTQYGGVWLDYDGHIQLVAVNSGATKAYMGVDTNGSAILASVLNGMMLNVACDNCSTNTGGLFFSSAAGVSGDEWVWDGSNGNFGQEKMYGAFTSTAMNMTPTSGSSSTPANRFVYSDGHPFIVVQGTTTSAITPNAGATTTVSYSPLFTTPAGYPANTSLDLKGEIWCASNCAGTQSAYVSIQFADALGSRTLYTCGTSTNIYCNSLSAPGTAWSFATSSYFPFHFPNFFMSGSQNLVLNIVTTNGGTAQPTYYLHITLAVH